MEGVETIGWSKGRTKDNDVRLAQMSASIKKAHAAGRYKNRTYNGRKPMSDATKQKISKARIAYLKENPDKVPYYRPLKPVTRIGRTDFNPLRSVTPDGISFL